MVSMIESVLVPTDGSDGALAGARRGIELAAATGADFHTISVIDSREADLSSSSESVDRTERERLLEQGAERAVDAVAEMARRHLSAPITTEVKWGRPFRSITEYAEAHDIDLIVMGTHGRTGLERVLLGSVAEKALRTTSVPICLIPPGADVAEISDVEYEDILLPTDGSKGAEIAVDWGIALADTYDAMVHTVYSVDTGRFSTADDIADIYDALEEVGQSAIETVRESARSAGVSVAGALGRGPAARVILSYADDHDIDLIVMGTHGRSGVDRYLIGSVTEAVVRNADVPVCCVPMTELS